MDVVFMNCPICKREDSHPDCDHLLAVVDQEEACCDGPAGSLFDNFISGRSAEEDYEDAIGERGEDWISRSDAIDTFDHYCRSVSGNSRSWSNYDDSPCFGGRCDSYYAKDVEAALSDLESRLGLSPAEEDVRRDSRITRQMEEESARRVAAQADRATRSSKGPIPPTLPTDFGGIVAPGRVHPHIEARHGARRRPSK